MAYYIPKGFYNDFFSTDISLSIRYYFLSIKNLALSIVKKCVHLDSFQRVFYKNNKPRFFFQLKFFNVQF